MKYLPAQLLFFLFLLSGCIGHHPPVHEYLLEPLAIKDPAANPITPLPGTILIGPVRLPPYLQASSLVTYSRQGELRRSNNHLWAGPLDELLARTITGNLARLLDSNRITVAPGSRFSKPYLQIGLNFLKFSGITGKTFYCHLTWTIAEVEKRRIIERHTFHITVPVDKPGFPGYVAAASQGLAAASQELATHIRQFLINEADTAATP